MRTDSGSYLTVMAELLAQGRTVTTRVRGSSMLPAIRDGAIVRILPMDDTTPRLGEVVALRDARGKLLCHRLVRVYARKGHTWVQTWGDTCHGPDQPVPATEIMGKVAVLVEGEKDTPVARYPAWRRRGRYVKLALRRLLDLSGAGGADPDCAIAGSGGDDGPG